MSKFTLVTIALLLASTQATSNCVPLKEWEKEPVMFCFEHNQDLCIGVSPYDWNGDGDLYSDLDIQIKSYKGIMEKADDPQEGVANRLLWKFVCNEEEKEYNMCLYEHPDLCIGLPHGAHEKTLLPIVHVDSEDITLVTFDFEHFHHKNTGALQIHYTKDEVKYCATTSKCKQWKQCSTKPQSDPDLIKKGDYISARECFSKDHSLEFTQKWVGKKAPKEYLDATPAPTPQPTTKAPTTTPPTTKAPTTKAPTTKAPTTKAPTTKAPTTKAPTTKAPTVKVNSIPDERPTNPPTNDRSSSSMKEELGSDEEKEGISGGGIFLIVFFILVIPFLYVLRKKCNDDNDIRGAYEQSGPLVGEESIKFDNDPKSKFTTIPLDDNAHYIHV